MIGIHQFTNRCRNFVALYYKDKLSDSELIAKLDAIDDAANYDCSSLDMCILTDTEFNTLMSAIMSGKLSADKLTYPRSVKLPEDVSVVHNPKFRRFLEDPFMTTSNYLTYVPSSTTPIKDFDDNA